MYSFRVGHGYDVHKLVTGRKLVLGGVEIPYEYGLLGHSDADVLIHAIMDALLGAMGLGDIGLHFPDTDNTYKDISSIDLLKKMRSILVNKKATVANIDATLVLQRPRVSSYIDLMKNNIALSLDIDPSCVNIKATTEEGLGFTGRKEGVSAHSVALLVFE